MFIEIPQLLRFKIPTRLPSSSRTNVCQSFENATKKKFPRNIVIEENIMITFDRGLISKMIVRYFTKKKKKKKKKKEEKKRNLRNLCKS